MKMPRTTCKSIRGNGDKHMSKIAQKTDKLQPNKVKAVAKTEAVKAPYDGSDHIAATDADYVTVIHGDGPANKIVKRKKDGIVTKEAAPAASEASAFTVRVSNPKDMADLLDGIGSMENATLCLGFIPGTEPGDDGQIGEDFKTLSSPHMGKVLGVDPETTEGRTAITGWHKAESEINGEAVSEWAICRLKENIRESSWTLFDIDATEGMPEWLANLTPDERREKLAEVIPGFDVCGKVILPSTTGRVLVDGKPMDATGEHIFVQIVNPDDLERFGAALLQTSTLSGYGFQKPVRSKSTGDVIHTRSWSIADPTTFVRGRMSYDGCPTIKGKGLSVADPMVTVVEGCRLDTSAIADATDAEAAEYLALTGDTVRKEMRTVSRLSADGTFIKCRVALYLTANNTRLKPDTIITTKSGAMTVLEYCISGSGHTRCQTPFRDSTSWNGYINKHKDGSPFVFDNGSRIKDVLSEEDKETVRQDVYRGSLSLLNELIAVTRAMDAPVDKKPIIEAFAKMNFLSETDKVIAEKEAASAIGLGRQVTAFRADVATEQKRQQSKNGKSGMDTDAHAAITDGEWPHTKPLPKGIFPMRTDDTLLSHSANYSAMLSAYGIESSYDVIRKTDLWKTREIDMTTDNAKLSLFSTIKGLAALNGLPHGNQDLHTHLPAIVEQHQINPVRDYLVELEWDGTDRFSVLAEAVGPHDIIIAEISLRVWFTGAAAACEHFETGVRNRPIARPSFEYVLALLGDQGVSKTKGFLGLVPKLLSRYVKDGVTLNPKNKDSVKIAVSYWLVELGELDATFKQGQIADMKAFLSTEADEFRMPYAATSSKFKRRTAFMGTVNQDKFLKDTTGNRRYLALECARGFPAWSAYDVDQLWAQAWSRYVGGAQWWPTDDEQKLLDANAELFRQRSWFEDELETKYQWGEKPDDHTRTRTTELLRHLTGGFRSNSDPKDVSDLGRALRRMWLSHGAYKYETHIMIRIDGTPTKVNSDGGKHKGWLLPPSRKLKLM
jgi:hypothetical protein